jgi:hypothetical protein
LYYDGAATRAEGCSGFEGSMPARCAPAKRRRSRAEGLVGWLTFGAAMLFALRLDEAPSWGRGLALGLVLTVGAWLEARCLVFEPARPDAPRAAGAGRLKPNQAVERKNDRG